MEAKEKKWNDSTLTAINMRGKFPASAVGGVADHVHALLSLPPNVSASEALRVVKANSERWVHEPGSRRPFFAWQPGCSAFSVSQLNSDAVIRYIAP